MATGVPVGFIVWWVRGKLFETEKANLISEKAAHKAGLEGEKSILEQRLKFAAEQLTASERGMAELQKEFPLYKEQVAVEGSNASPAKVDAAIKKVADSNTKIGSSLFELYRNLEFGFGQYGALKKVDYETLKKLENIGKPFNNIGYETARETEILSKVRGTTLNSIPDDVKK